MKYNNQYAWHSKSLDRELEPHEVPKTAELRRSRNNSDVLFFASQFEYEVYLLLRDFVPAKNIQLQVPLRVKPETLKWPAVYWRVDFSINVSETIWFIEAKGHCTLDFKNKLMLLECFYPQDYSQLVLVHEKNNKQWKKLKTKNSFQLPTTFTKKELKKWLESIT